MKQLSFLCIFIFLLCASGKAIHLSKDAEISIITCSPGGELYSLFGHTAIRVLDPEQGIDVVYNYGTFDFKTPHFYLKYARGLLPYQLTKTPFPYFMYSYQEEGRSVYSQTLKLDSLQKQEMLDLLEINYRPENRFYLYNFLFDNCTTRSRDIVQKSLPEKIDWNTADTGKNFWNLLDEYLSVSPWVKWGIHTILGQGGNRQATTFEYMFLPDYLMYGLNTARYRDQRLATDAETLYQAPELEITSPWYRTPFFVFATGVLILIVLLQKYRNAGLLNTVSVVFFLFTGILGCLIVFLGGFTAHPITAPNWNILWANPLNLFVLPFIFRSNMPGIIRGYLKIYIALLTIAVPVWAIAQPAVPMASVSLIVFMIYLCFRLRNKK